MNVAHKIQMVAFAGSTLLAFSSAQAARVQQAFSYDAAGRLTNVVTDSGTAEISLNEHYQFDASGNIIEKVVDGQTVRMSYDAANQLMSRTDDDGTVNFAYDSAGRLVAERKNDEVIAKYEYGYLDKVTQVTRGEQVTQFHYNARGMLVAKERDGKITETFGWDGIGLLAKDGVVYANEAHVSGGVPLAAVHAGSENAEMQYFDSDYLGTTTAVYSADGQVDAKLVGSYGAGSEFGELRFTGKPYDADLDAHVFPYRNYKSEAGSWASADPAGFPDGPNQHYYACVPTMALDPMGLATWGVRVVGSMSDNGTDRDDTGASELGVYGNVFAQQAQSTGSIFVEANVSTTEYDVIFNDVVALTNINFNVYVDSQTGELSVTHTNQVAHKTRSNPSLGVGWEADAQIYGSGSRNLDFTMSFIGTYNPTGLTGGGLSILGNGASLSWTSASKHVGATAGLSFEAYEL
jgi:RHS repeat-associated protein